MNPTRPTAPTQAPIPTEHTEAAAEALVDRLVAEMAVAGRGGGGLCADDLLRRHPWLADHPEAALRLVYEEVCLRQESGDADAAADVLRKFPQWQEQLRVMLDCQRVLGLGPAAPQFPQLGETLGDFHILAELGRGGQGRVFLARQASLADRPLVLKVTRCEGQEHLSLARLQHTHIAPLYWAQDLPARDLRLLCMPFLGVVTLARLMQRLAATPPAVRTGADVLRVLDEGRAEAPVALPAQGPDRDRLARGSYAQAVCGIGACLADALAHAHGRGLVHLDLKPSNVLLDADGQPLVLDFHLARRPVEAGEVAPEWLGGTRDYLSPEQAAALAAVATGQPVPARVDGRSDQYALGLVLYELLGGTRSGDEAPQPLGLPAHNPAVSVGLADILARSLAADSAARYPGAAGLAADLRRHLQDLPLRGVPNRSLRERWAKWRRHRPHELPIAAAILLTLAALLGSGVLFANRWAEQRHGAAAALDQGQKRMAHGEFDAALQLFEQGRDQAAAVPGEGRLVAAFDEHLALARRARKARELNEFTEQLRFLGLLDPLPPRMNVLLQGSTILWRDRDALLRTEAAPLEAHVEQAVRTDLIDLALITADLRGRLAPAAQAEAAHRAAWRLLDEAEAQFGPSAALDRQREVHARAAGDAAAAERFARRARVSAPYTVWEHYALARCWLLRGDPAAAAPLLERAAAMEPFGFLPHFYLGMSALRSGDPGRAASEFNFCAGRAPRWECFYYRALAHAAAGRLDDALQDDTLALKLDPTSGVAALHRAIVRRGLGQLDEALADLDFAQTHAAAPAEVYYQRALVQLARDDRAAATQNVRAALRLVPRHAGALDLQKQLSAKE